jgi:hypothetical protein
MQFLDHYKTTDAITFIDTHGGQYSALRPLSFHPHTIVRSPITPPQLETHKYCISTDNMLLMRHALMHMQPTNTIIPAHNKQI